MKYLFEIKTCGLWFCWIVRYYYPPAEPHEQTAGERRQTIVVQQKNLEGTPLRLFVWAVGGTTDEGMLVLRSVGGCRRRGGGRAVGIGVIGTAGIGNRSLGHLEGGELVVVGGEGVEAAEMSGG